MSETRDQYTIDKATAERIGKRTARTDGFPSRIEWLSHGTTSSHRKPGTLWKAEIHPFEGEPKREFQVFTPAPRNGKRFALSLLVRFLKRETFGVAGASVIEVFDGKAKAIHQA
jgi:hypothetical protein